MENNNSLQGKVRTRSSKVNRTNPYGRKNQVKDRTLSENQHEQTLLGKVTDYIVPTWISSWWKPNENSKVVEEDYSSESEVEDQPSVTVQTNTDVQQPTFENVVPTRPPIIQSTAIKPPTVSGFYQKNAGSSLNRPSFLDDTTESSQADSSQPGSDSSRLNVSVQSSLYRKPLKSPFETKPTFNVSAFVSPNLSSEVFDTSSQNSSAFNLSASNRSLFYNGQTKYGGSSTYRNETIKRQKMNPVSNRVRTSRTQIKAKPLSTTKRSSVTSATAKRILEKLDKMNSPVKDSKRLPPLKNILSNPLTFSQKLRESSKKVDAKLNNVKSKPPVSTLDTYQPTRRFNLSKNNSVNESKIPVINPLSSTDKFSFTEKSKPLESFLFGKSAEKLPTSKPTEGFSFAPKAQLETMKPPKMPPPVAPKPPKPPVESLYGRSTGKLRRERTSTHYTAAVEKHEEVINTMPTVVKNVPLVVDSMPKINFSVNISSASSLTPKKNPEQSMKNEKKIVSFSFANPGVLNDKMFTPPTKNFSFSKPVIVDSSKTLPPTENKRTGEPNKIKQLTNLAQKPVGSWECEVCMIENKPEVEKCVACEAKKPGDKLKTIAAVAPTFCSKRPPAQPLKQLSKKFTKPAGSWECSMCMIENKAESEKCVACESPNPNSVAKRKAFTAKPMVEPPKKLLNLPKQAEGSWSCPTCMVDNKQDVLNCVACQEKKPGSESAKSSETTNFSFGIKSNSEKPSFSFGVKPTDPPASFSLEKSNSTLGSDSKAPLFSFGVKPTDSAVSFGTTPPTSNDTPVMPAFKFKSKPIEKAPAVPSFSFGTKPVENDKAVAPSFTFVAKSAENDKAAASSFSFGAKSAENDKAAPSFSFGAKPAESDKAAPSFSFGAKPAEDDKPAAPSFSFGAKPAENDKAAAPSFNFGAKLAENNKPAAPSFSFGAKPAENDKPAAPPFSFSAKPDENDKPTAPSFSFSAKPAENDKPAAPLFSVGAKPAENNKPAASSFSFGAKPDENDKQAALSFSFSAKPAENDKPAAPLFSIGAKPAVNNKPAASSFSFGAKPDENVKPAAPSFSFGAKPAENDKPAAPSFSFGAKPAETNKPAAPSFSFGAKPVEDASLFSANPAAGETSAAAPAFSFGVKTSETNAAPPIFGKSAAESGASAGFNFGSSATPNFNFGGSTAAPSFNAAPSFMSPAPSAGGFNFGGATNGPTNGPTNGLFSMGAAPASNPTRKIRQPRRRLKK